MGRPRFFDAGPKERFRLLNMRHVLTAAALLGAAGCHPKAPSDHAFRIVATDSGFDAPDKVLAGLRHIVFENHGSEIHEAMLVKLAPGMTAGDYVAEVKRGALFPKGAQDFSGPGLTSPGERVEVWVKVEPGNYLLICWNDGHARSVPVHPFTVEETIANDDVPHEDLVLKLIDYRFELSGALHKGWQTIRVETTGPSMHEVDLFRFRPGKGVADVSRWRKAHGRGPSPVDAMGGALDNHDLRRVVWLRRNFSPGRYLLHCEMPVMPNAQADNQELTHADLGMVREIEIDE